VVARGHDGGAVAVASTLSPGQTFAGYRIESVLGRGGMGVVYLATQLALERRVALKLLAPHLAEDARFRERFLRESRIAAAIEHPHILRVYDAGEEDGTLFLAMRYVEGADLGAHLERERRLAPDRALGLLAEVAAALDTAHARGLVHRDVKPGNILIDAAGEAYLFDFGLTKPAAAEAGLTGTGEVVGSLDYMAPEQIRVGPVDGRADQYSLACVLFECLSGRPPFRHETAAQTMWAHLQEEPPSVADERPDLPSSLDAAVARGLAKQPDERYPSCGELVASARAALNGAGEAVVAAPARRSLQRWAWPIAVAGALLLAAAVAAAVVALTRDSGTDALTSLAPNSVGVIEPASNRIVAQIPVGRNPTSVAYGEGAVWVLNADDQTISRIDPETKEEQRFGTGLTAIGLAAGEGAVWVLNAGSQETATPVRTVTRIHPETGATVTIELPPGNAFEAGARVPGAREIVVGDGAVFAIGADGLVSRIDPRANEVAASIDAGVVPGSIAVDNGALWVAERFGKTLVQVDLGSGEVVATLDVDTVFVSGIAAGGGLVWATDSIAGTVWRIEPGGISQTIAVGEGAAGIAYGEGSAWVASTGAGQVARVDAGTASDVETIAIGSTPQAIAVGAGAVWVAAGEGVEQPETTEGEVTPLPASFCGDLLYEGDAAGPQYLIVSDLPLRGGSAALGRPIEAAIEQVLREREFRAGPYRVGYQSCDDSSTQEGFDTDKCIANSRAYGANGSVLGVVGPVHSDCAQFEIPIANQAGLAMVSPTNSATYLTNGEPSDSPNILARLYPTGTRNYLRVMPNDRAQGAAHAMLAAELGATSVFVLGDDQRLLYPFHRATDLLGIEIAGESVIDPEAASYADLADQVAGSGAGMVFLADFLDSVQDGQLLRDLRARLGEDFPISTGDGWFPEGAVEVAGDAARGLLISTHGIPNPELPAEGQAFVAELAPALPGEEVPSFSVVYGAQAVEVLLDAIARSDGTRASVVQQLFATRVANGLIGDFSFDANGDPTLQAVTFMRVAPPSEGETIVGQKGAVLDRVITVPPELLAEEG
jgi:ABC-type branched-subunit amino acid transport system substrate-binding protein